MEIAVRTDTGRVRTRNEDSALALQWQMAGDQAGATLVIAAVADGMGGHTHGHIASKMALRALAATLVQGAARAPLEGPETLSDEQMVNLLAEAVASSANHVNQAEQHGLVDMGTTLCAAFLIGNRTLIANIGDSRAYLLDSGVQQITTDHSLVAQLVAKGELTPEEALVHPKRNEIYRMLGFGRPSQPDFFSLYLEPSDILLLCSDGLSNLVRDEEMLESFSGQAPLDSAAQRLIDLANARGGTDNITVVAVRLASPAERAGDDS